MSLLLLILLSETLPCCLVEPWDLEQLLCLLKPPTVLRLKEGEKGMVKGVGVKRGSLSMRGRAGGCGRAGGVFLLAQCFSYWGPWTSSMGLTWEFVKHDKSPPTPQVALSQKLWDGASDVFQGPSG